MGEQLGNEAARDKKVSSIDKSLKGLLETTAILGSRLTDIADRTLGSRPEKGSEGQPNAAPNGTLDSFHLALLAMSDNVDVIREQVNRLDEDL